jgi:hypothetical protein
LLIWKRFSELERLKYKKEMEFTEGCYEGL